MLCGSSYALLSDVERSYMQPFRRRSGSGTFQEIFPHSSRTTTGADSQRAPYFLPVNPNPTRRRHLFPSSCSCPPSALLLFALVCSVFAELPPRFQARGSTASPSVRGGGPDLYKVSELKAISLTWRQVVRLPVAETDSGNSRSFCLICVIWCSNSFLETGK